MNERLFSVDPIGAINNVKDALKRYLRWAYRTKDKAVDNMRIGAFNNDGVLYKDPYLELQPDYEQIAGMKDIAEMSDIYHDKYSVEPWMKDFFQTFIKKGLMNYVPYVHQKEMMEKAFFEKRNVVITSGTGSGKTESFLLPLLAQIVSEGLKWERADLSADWYDCQTNHNRYVPCQRNGEVRKSALRAMILYPMNALVEDQLTRLRKALDSDAVRAYCDMCLNGNRIFFGHYTGNTIARKNYNLISAQGNATLAIEEKRVGDELENIKKRFSDIKNFYNAMVQINPNTDDSVLYVAPRLAPDSVTAEMLTRWDMQETPPDIMVTNTSMLSIMLMRQAEQEIFDKTREWLKESEENVFHLVVDELHLYRGTAGSEVACLVRMLYRALGLEPVVNGHPNPQLRILASSASLGTTAETDSFLREFFGIDCKGAFEVQEGIPYQQSKVKNSVKWDLFSLFTPAFIDLPEADKLRNADKFAVSQGYGDLKDFLEKCGGTLFDTFTDFFTDKIAQRLIPRPLPDLWKATDAIFNSEDEARGFLIFRGYVDGIKEKPKMPRLRFHQFFKYVEGLWGELNPNSQGGVIAEVSFVPHETGSHGHKMLELLRCESCGALYIGGNRKSVNGKEYMTLNYPDLTKIPSMNPTPMVQNKSYGDYIIFYPQSPNSTNISLEPDRQDHVARLSDNSTEFKKTNARAYWEKAWLDCDTGEVSTQFKTNSISGYIFRIERYNNQQNFDARDIQALPCHCPSCNQNFTRRKYTKSPVRSFRSGIQRINQLLSKELMYQLQGEKPKLIGFSDSRNDAAEQAYGIENEHYRDMVRKTLADSVAELDSMVKEIRSLVVAGRLAEVLTKFGKDLYAMTITQQIIQNAHSSLITEQFPLDVLRDRMLQRLIRLGINPSGVDYSRQFVGNTSSEWHTAYDFETGVFNQNATAQFQALAKDRLTSAIYANSFGKYMGVTTVDSGLGYIGVNRDQTVSSSQEFLSLKATLHLMKDDEVYDFVDAYIRILGDNYRYPDEDFKVSEYHNYDEYPSELKNAIRNYANGKGLNEKTIGRAMHDFLEKYAATNTVMLSSSKLVFRPSKGGDPYYKCSNCGRVHLSKGNGFCTNTKCLEPLPVVRTGDVYDLWDHFVAYDIMKMPREARRLHTEELTGQTDDMATRLLHFKDIVLKGAPEPQCIDMVNVTTTMEVGVDIGSLQAVFQGNMPPTRYNYQQRVGRGGRRDQAFSAVFTFCRGRSHDSYYYNSGLDRMVGDIPVAPRLSLTPYDDIDSVGNTVKRLKLSLFRRVIIKSIFREALGSSFYDYNLNDQAGEFGMVGQWNAVRDKVREWMKNHPDVVRDIVDTYMMQFDKQGQERNLMLTWLNNCMLSDIESMVTTVVNKDKGLGQWMAENGFLPKYGLPSEVRSFYHGYDMANHAIRSIDRDVETSITEFAPGQERIKDKGKFRIDGLACSPMSPGGRPGRYSPSALIGMDALSDSYTMQWNPTDSSIVGIREGYKEDELVDNNNDTWSKEASEQIRLVIPQAYRTDIIEGNKGNIIENNDRKTSFSQSLIFPQHCTSSKGPRSIANIKVNLYGTSANDMAHIWHINTNNGRWFKGSYSTYDGNRQRPNNDKTQDATGYFHVEAGVENPIAIAIGSRKATEMLHISIAKVPPQIDLNVNTGISSAIKAAFYSAASLIQRTLADKLDVQPDEIEISMRIGENGVPEIYLSDALPNGASLVSYLFQLSKLVALLRSIVDFKTPFMKSLINPVHSQKCNTSCQECLNTYSNRGYHHIIDWRMGVGLIRLMLDSTYDFGYSTYGVTYGELKDVTQIWDICRRKLKFSPKQDKVIRQLPLGLGYEYDVLAHPLWNKDYVAKRYGITDNMVIHDTFHTLRSDLNGSGKITPNTEVKESEFRDVNGIVMGMDM